MNKTVIITGSSRGIGRQTAIAFAKEGYNVVINYINSKNKAEELLEELKGYSVIAIKSDVSKNIEVKSMIAETINKFGKIDVLVNNAGVAMEKLFTETSEEEFDRLFSINVKGIYNCCKEVIPDMVRRKEGNIINISSMYGISGASCEVIYSATKAAVIGLTQGLARELGPSNINVNCVAPGCIDTEMTAYLNEEERKQIENETPLGIWGTTEDIANAILFLASNKSKFITGQVLSPNGGYII